ncbi:hypothetical protein NEOLEDRAFT_1073444, partial [Neolentinus lepideus HHB14362 ss-1]
GCICFHKADFLDVFINSLPEGIAHFNKRISFYVRSASDPAITLHFMDDLSASCDLLVGCDGIKSTVRGQIYREQADKVEAEGGDWRSILDCIEPIWSGTITYRGLRQAEKLLARHRALCAPMKHVVSYSISQGSIVNVVTFASDPEKEGTLYEEPWMTQCPQQGLLNCYANGEPEVEELLNVCQRPPDRTRTTCTTCPNAIALPGDAVRFLPPQTLYSDMRCQGAFILSSLLTHPDVDRGTLNTALRAYEHARVRKATRVLQGSWDATIMCEFNSPGYGDDCSKLADVIRKQWDWVWESTPESGPG